MPSQNHQSAASPEFIRSLEQGLTDPLDFMSDGIRAYLEGMQGREGADFQFGIYRRAPEVKAGRERGADRFFAIQAARLEVYVGKIIQEDPLDVYSFHHYTTPRQSGLPQGPVTSPYLVVAIESSLSVDGSKTTHSICSGVVDARSEYGSFDARESRQTFNLTCLYEKKAGVESEIARFLERNGLIAVVTTLPGPTIAPVEASKPARWRHLGRKKPVSNLTS